MSKEKDTFDSITAKLVIQQLFKSANIMKIVHLKTNSYAVHKATDEYFHEMFELSDKLAEVHFGIIGKKEIDEIPSARYIDPVMHLTDISKYIISNKSLFKSSEEQNILDEIQVLIGKTKYLLSLE